MVDVFERPYVLDFPISGQPTLFSCEWQLVVGSVIETSPGAFLSHAAPKVVVRAPLLKKKGTPWSKH